MLAPDAERTTTVVIGAGMPGLAVASELCRHGVDAIVVSGLNGFPFSIESGQPGTGSLNTGKLPRCDGPDAASLQERNEILRHLRNYAASHHLDVRNTTPAVRLDLLAHQQPLKQKPEQKLWAIHTEQGVLLADNIVLTRCGQSQLRRMLADLGIAIGQNLTSALRAMGMYLVGVGELVSPTPKEVLRQAKVVGQAISAKVHPDNALAGRALTGSFAALA
ncbi:FAD-binding protein [Arthrobacter sp. SW1]|uniref:FAD-binding protein n=1 Tax=Arthrobacter sp. SW1 TaxID=1920889 RepID=UPI000877CAA2|nr:FAD-binding protein [Arthrobacter sp. SW1]OFI38680.1 FAD-binding protein [Arthrobacter sp. SW1]